MSYYEILLFLHIVGATIWLGSAFMLQALLYRAQKTDDNVLVERITSNTQWLADSASVLRGVSCHTAKTHVHRSE